MSDQQEYVESLGGVYIGTQDGIVYYFIGEELQTARLSDFYREKVNDTDTSLR